MNGNELLQWRADLRAHGAALAELTRVQKAGLKQFYSFDELCDRYALGRPSMLAALATHLGYHGQRGKPVRIHLDQVLALDQVLRTEAIP